MPEDARLADLKFGPFYIQPRIGIRDLGYDSNVLGANDESNLKVDDFRVTPMAGLQLYLPFRGRHVISGDSEAGYQWFKDNDELRGWNYAFEGSYEYTSDRLEATVSNRYVNAQTNQLEQLDLSGGPTTPGNEIFARTRTKTNDLTGDLQFNVRYQTFVGVRGGLYSLRYPGDTPQAELLAADLDYDATSIGGYAGLKLRPGVGARAFYDYRKDDYATPDNFRSVTTWRSGLEFTFDRERSLTGLVRVGYRDLTPEQEEQVGFSGVIGDLNLRTVLGGRVELSLDGNRDVYPSIWGRNAFYLRQGGGADLLYRLSRRLGLGGGASIHGHEYEVEVNDILRSDTITRFDGIISWTFDRNDLRLRIGYYDRSSNVPLQDQSGLIVSTGYVARF